jgi:magnesium transporter
VGETLATTRPAPLSRVWSGRRIIADDLQGDDLSDVLELHSEASAWWVLPRDESAVRELRSVAGQLDLDEFAIKDLMATDRRAKFDQLDQVRLLISNVLELDRDKVQLIDHPISVIATDRALICATNEFDGFRPAQLLAAKQDWLTVGGVEAALQTVVASVISSYEEVAAWLEDSSDHLADALFEERPLNKDEQLQAFRLRTVLSHLRRMTDPMRAVISELADSLPDGLPKQTRTALNRHWRLLEERHQRVANAADALREALSSVFDTSLALADVRLNSIMKKLTGWAAIIAVPTLITGFVGQNVLFPLVGTHAGFWIYFLIMFASAVALYLVFRRQDWI